MRHDYLDRYSRLSSPIHRLPAALKISIAFAFIMACVLSSSGTWYLPAGIGTLLVLIIPLSGIPVSFVVKRLVVFEPFVLVVALLMLLQPNAGLNFISILLKSTVSLLTLILLSNTVPFDDLLRFMRRTRVPSIIVTILALMYRYVFVLIDEAERANRARRSRTFTGGRRFTWYSLALIVGQLFVRSTERAERVFAAMSARGWK